MRVHVWFIQPVIFAGLVSLSCTHWTTNNRNGGRRSVSAEPPPGPSIIDLDLANPVLTRTVSAGTYKLRLRHRLPSQRYSFEVVEERIPLPELDSIPHTGNVLYATGDVTCNQALPELSAALDATAEETALDATLNSWIEKHPSCEQNGVALFDRRTALLSGDVYTLHEQYQLKIRVARAGVKDSAVWQFTLATQPRGEFRTLYGFTFVPDRDDHYFSEAGDSTGFIVRKKHDAKKGDLDLSAKFTPSVLFSWLPNAPNRSWSFGPVAGVGYNFDKLATFLGMSAVYNENIMLTGGVAMHQQARLNGKYKRDQAISENLEEAQLVENSFRPNLYFGFALRLGKDPFTPREGQAPTTGSQPPADNKAPEENSASDNTGVSFDPESAKAGQKVGTFTIASAKTDTDPTVFKFSGELKDVTGSLKTAKIGNETQTCIKPEEAQLKRIPAPTDEVANLVCFGVSPAALKDMKVDDPLKVSFKDLIATIPKDDPSTATYTATMTAASKASK